MSPGAESSLRVEPLTPADRTRWEVLFRGYIAFYERTLPDERYDQACEDFASGARVHALGARLNGELIGIAHFFIHANTSGPDVCYLQDLFTAPANRGQGAARLITVWTSIAPSMTHRLPMYGRIRSRTKRSNWGGSWRGTEQRANQRSIEL